jgi:hypothetical protein
MIPFSLTILVHGENREAEIASIRRLFGRSGLFATRSSPGLQNIDHERLGGAGGILA